MHRRFLSRRGAAVDPDIVGAVIGCGICRVNAEGDQPTCTGVADLIVDRLSVAAGDVTDSVAVPTGPSRRVPHGPAGVPDFHACALRWRSAPRPRVHAGPFRGRIALVEVDASLF